AQVHHLGNSLSPFRLPLPNRDGLVKRVAFTAKLDGFRLAWCVRQDGGMGQHGNEQEYIDQGSTVSGSSAHRISRTILLLAKGIHRLQIRRPARGGVTG